MKEQKLVNHTVYRITSIILYIQQKQIQSNTRITRIFSEFWKIQKGTPFVLGQAPPNAAPEKILE